jgi:WD40 repeat protein
VRAIAFAPWGGALATGSVDHTVRVWDLPSGAQVRKFVRHENQVGGLAWSSRGVLASASTDGTIELVQLGNPADLPPPSRSFEEIQKRQWLKMVRFELRPDSP